MLEPLKAKFPWISYADLWTLAGAVSVEAMGGAEGGRGWESRWRQWEAGGGASFTACGSFPGLSTGCAIEGVLLGLSTYLQIQ